MAEATHDSHEHHHAIDPKVFIKTFGLLTILMIATIGASFVHWGPEGASWPTYLANVIALTIACVKATLVILNFMGVKHASRLIQVYAAMGFVWVTLMGIVVCDYATRHWEPQPHWDKVQPSPNTQKLDPAMTNPFAVEGH